MLSYIGRQQLCGKLSKDPELTRARGSGLVFLFLILIQNHLEYKCFIKMPLTLSCFLSRLFWTLYCNVLLPQKALQEYTTVCSSKAKWLNQLKLTLLLEFFIHRYTLLPSFSPSLLLLFPLSEYSPVCIPSHAGTHLCTCTHSLSTLYKYFSSFQVSVVTSQCYNFTCFL